MKRKLSVILAAIMAVSLFVTAAYASIANGGVYTKPIFFTKILDRNGKELITMEPETHRVLKDSTAFLLTDAMAESMISNRKFRLRPLLHQHQGQASQHVLRRKERYHHQQQ